MNGAENKVKGNDNDHYHYLNWAENAAYSRPDRPETTETDLRLFFAYLGGMTCSDSDDAALWSALQAEAGVRAAEGVLPPPLKTRRPKKVPREPPPVTGPLQGPRLRYPWETATFDPGDEWLSQRIQAGQRLTDLILGLTVYESGGSRWILLQSSQIWWSSRLWLAYTRVWGTTNKRAMRDQTDAR